MKADNEGLQSVIDGIKNDQFALQTQVDRLKQKISDQYDRYRAEVGLSKELFYLPEVHYNYNYNYL